MWRVRDEAALREAEIELVQAQTATEAAGAVVAAAAALVGGEAARIEDGEGRVLATVGPSTEGADQVLRVQGVASAVTVVQSSYTPVFGHDEQVMLRQLCSHLDLALRRIEAFDASEQ